jgi:hypothetical protein
MFFNEVVGKKNKHKNRKAIWFEYIIAFDEFQQIMNYPEKNVEAILRTHHIQHQHKEMLYSENGIYKVYDVFFSKWLEKN